MLLLSGGGENRTPVRNKAMKDIYMLSRLINFLFEPVSETKTSSNQPAKISS